MAGPIRYRRAGLPVSTMRCGDVTFCNAFHARPCQHQEVPAYAIRLVVRETRERQPSWRRIFGRAQSRAAVPSSPAVTGPAGAGAPSRPRSTARICRTPGAARRTFAAGRTSRIVTVIGWACCRSCRRQRTRPSRRQGGLNDRGCRWVYWGACSGGLTSGRANAVKCSVPMNEVIAAIRSWRTVSTSIDQAPKMSGPQGTQVGSQGRLGVGRRGQVPPSAARSHRYPLREVSHRGQPCVPAPQWWHRPGDVLGQHGDERVRVAALERVGVAGAENLIRPGHSYSGHWARILRWSTPAGALRIVGDD